MRVGWLPDEKNPNSYTFAYPCNSKNLDNATILQTMSMYVQSCRQCMSLENPETREYNSTLFGHCILHCHIEVEGFGLIKLMCRALAHAIPHGSPA